MPDGDFIVEYDAEHRQVFAAPVTNPVNFSIPGMTAGGTGLELKAWFSGSPSCVKTSVFDAPAKPAIALSNVKPSDADCTTTSKVTFDLDYTYQQGTLTYWVDEMSAQTASYSVADMSEQHLYDRTFTDIPADGQIHTLHVQFDGANSCETSVDFKAPLTYAINSVYVSGVPTEILCGATGYTATVTVSLPYNAAIGKDIVLSYEGKESHATVTSNPFEAVIPLTATDATGLTVTAHFSDAP
jgi:hypothetical protein